ncbi:MAG: hypothetical protein ACOYJC_10985 [Christensenellales bacterium]
MKRNLEYDDRLVTAVIDRISIGVDKTLTVRLANRFKATTGI